MASIYYKNDLSDAVRGRPETVQEFHHYARAKWKTGKELAFGGEGTDGSNYCKFIYSQGTDSSYKAQNWSEEYAANEPGRRTALISTPEFDLKSNESKVFDGCISVVSQTLTPEVLLNLLDTIQQSYNRQDFTLKNKPNPTQPNTLVFPNPVQAGSAVRLQTSHVLPNALWHLYDAHGKLVLQGFLRNGTTECEAPLTKGTYFFKMGYAHEWRMYPLVVY